MNQFFTLFKILGLSSFIVIISLTCSWFGQIFLVLCANVAMLYFKILDMNNNIILDVDKYIFTIYYTPSIILLRYTGDSDYNVFV